MERGARRGYLGRMASPVPGPQVPPRPSGRSPQRAESLGSQAASAARAAAAFYRGWRTGKTSPDPLALERQRQAARYSAALSQYRSKAAALRARFAAGTAGVVGGAVVASAAFADIEPGAPLVVAGGSAVALGVWQAAKGHRGLQRLQAPAAPVPIAAPPPPLPVGTTAAVQAQRVTRLRLHIVELLPTVEMLHPQAADEIRAADAATAPGLNAVVERIRSMQRITAQLPDSPAAASAQISVDALTIRLTEGGNAYQELLDAVIGLSSAPALTGGPSQTLGPAIADMQAYAAGLQTAARTWS